MLPTRFILPPGPREGIVINLAEYRLYYYPKGQNVVYTFPLGIGREGWGGHPYSKLEAQLWPDRRCAAFLRLEDRPAQGAQTLVLEDRAIHR